MHHGPATAGTIGADERLPHVMQTGDTARLHLTMAVADYDHVHDLTSGNIRPEGIVLTPFILPVEEIFFRFIKFREWDVSELSFAKFIALTSQGDAPMVGIPVFPSRVFRHSAIYVRADRGMTRAADLNGKTIGIPEWAQTAGIYVRGMLEETYGVDLSSIAWVQAGVNEAGRDEKVQLNLPSGIGYRSRPDASLNDMLLSGEVDGIISARPPRAFLEGHPDIVRLFPDYRSQEMQYWKTTGIFPIMHTITVRRAVFEQYPWVGVSLLKAFDAAKRLGIERVRDFAASRIPLPWIAASSEEIGRDFGEDFWPYGLEPNRVTLDAFCRFAYSQGITERRMTPEDLFPKQVHGMVKV